MSLATCDALPTRATSRRVLQGRYKWLIYGDDDSIHFPEGIARALEAQQLDANMPYFVSGGLRSAELCSVCASVLRCLLHCI